MATSTLIQYIAAGEAANTGNRSQEETFKAGGAIVAGDWVALDVSQTGADKTLYVVQSPATLNSGLAVGVALEAAASGARVRVCIGGYCASANVATGTAAGATLCLVAVAGRAGASVTSALGAATTTPIGVGLTLAAANVAEVWVNSRF